MQLSAPRWGMAAVEVGGKLLFAGGSDGLVTSPVVDVLDLASGGWSTLALPLPRTGMAAVASGSRAWFAGGFEPDPSHPGSLRDSDRVEIYDPLSGTWSLERLSAARSELAVTELDGRLIFAGGIIGSLTPSDLVDVLDLASGSWSTLRLELAQGQASGASVADRALIVGGGADILLAGFPRSFCAGDGSGAACPCGNEGGAGTGCVNSTGAGARLDARGCHDIDAPSLALEASGLTAVQPALFFAGLDAIGAGAGLAFGDGLRCVGGGVQRLGVESSTPMGGASFTPDFAALGWVAGDLRRFQVWYRDPAGPCSAGFNTTPAIEVTVAP
jgi:hypothetical protein